MHLKVLTSIALLAVLVVGALAWRSTTIGFQSRDRATITVTINQAPAKDSVTPIEIIQPTVVSSAPNKLDDLTYIIRNNSGRAVIAAAVIKTINYEEKGRVYAHSVYSTIDSAFHPDMGGRPLLPGTQMSMESAGPIGFDEGVVIKDITLTLDYALYDDHTVYGSGGEGERRINAMREGARRYKSWLAQEYSRADKSLVSILPVIEAPSIPQALKMDSDQIMGADRYRLNLLKTFKTKGAAEVENYLKQNQ